MPAAPYPQQQQAAQWVTRKLDFLVVKPGTQQPTDHARAVHSTLLEFQDKGSIGVDHLDRVLLKRLVIALEYIDDYMGKLFEAVFSKAERTSLDWNCVNNNLLTVCAPRPSPVPRGL